MSETVEDFLAMHELVKAAKARLDKGIWDYVTGATETETTLKRNRIGIDSLVFKRRVLRRMSKIDLTSSLFGRKVRLPVLMAPVGSLESLEPGGGATAAKATAEFGVPLMLSSQCRPGIEETAAAAPDGFRMYQLYVRGDGDYEDEIVKRAVDHGYTAFAVTVDSAHYSRRERDIANRYVKPWRIGLTGLNYQADYDWDNVKRFKDKHQVPLILKGIAAAEDAEEAVRLGVEGIYVSNHGGRQLDHDRGSIEVLPEVVQAVGGKATVIVDGGFMRGTDVIKAIALGADAVGLGRMFALALGAAGQAGVVRMLELLEEEMTASMALLGEAKLADLRPDHLAPALPVGPTHVFSGLPLLGEGY